MKWVRISLSLVAQAIFLFLMVWFLAIKGIVRGVAGGPGSIDGVRHLPKATHPMSEDDSNH
jgi:hypothetical protein